MQFSRFVPNHFVIFYKIVFIAILLSSLKVESIPDLSKPHIF